MKLPNGYGSVVKLSGKRRRPWMVRKTTGYHIDTEKGKKVNEYLIIGYAATKTEGLQMLAEFNNNPYDTKAAKMTFAEVYEAWSKKKYESVSDSSIKSYSASYNACTKLYDLVFKDIKLVHLQETIDSCGKNYPTLKKIKVLFNQLYAFALQNDICNKDYSTYVDIAQYKDRNPNKHSNDKFTNEEIAKIWTMKDNKYYQIILMLIYNGVRISEFLNLKKEHVHLDEQYFDVIGSKTDNGLRKVPIPDKLLPYYRDWYESCPECKYLLHTEDGKHFKYRNYFDSYWKPLVEPFDIKRTPHSTRHTLVSLLKEAEVLDTTIKKIVGHAGAMSLTEKVYTHLDMNILIAAVNKVMPTDI